MILIWSIIFFELLNNGQLLFALRFADLLPTGCLILHSLLLLIRPVFVFCFWMFIVIDFLGVVLVNLYFEIDLLFGKEYVIYLVGFDVRSCGSAWVCNLDFAFLHAALLFTCHSGTPTLRQLTQDWPIQILLNLILFSLCSFSDVFKLFSFIIFIFINILHCFGLLYNVKQIHLVTYHFIWKVIMTFFTQE